MTSRDFCYWLQGFLEISQDKNMIIIKDQVDVIRNHLNMVFYHEIDPSMGDEKQQDNLNKIHSPFNIQDQLVRC
jgi:hypothetical protein